MNRNDLANKVGVEWNGEALLEVNRVNSLKLLNLNYITDEETFFNFSCFDAAHLLCGDQAAASECTSHIQLFSRVGRFLFAAPLMRFFQRSLAS